MVPVRELIETWSSVYSNSPALRSAIGFAHVGGLLAGGGCAIASDLATIRAMRRGSAAVAHEATRLHDVHRVVIASLAVVVVSGFLLMFADVDAYLVSTTFWIKMAAVVTLVVNGAWLMRAGDRAAEHGHVSHLQIACVASLILWTGTTLLGATLPNVL
jgi:hypothetical protein